MFFQNLNVFFACFMLLAIFAAAPLLIIISILLSSFHSVLKYYSVLMYPIAYILLSLPLFYFWWKTGLSPVGRKPERERRYRIGHWVVGFANIGTIVTLAIPFLLAYFAGNRGLLILAWFAAPVFALGFLIWGIGLFMIWSSRA